MAEEQGSQQSEKSPEEVAFYAGMVAAWFNSKLERDKSLLTLSAGGIGLLITLLTSFGVSSSLALIIYMLAMLCFVVSAVSAIFIFEQNTKHLERVHREEEEKSKLLSALDTVIVWSFLLGVVLSMAIALSYGIDHLRHEGGKVMTEKKIEKILQSSAGAERVKPKEVVNKSYNEAASMRPKRAPAQETTKPQASSGTSQNTGTGSSDKK